MSRHLTDADVHAIVEMLNAWKGNLTWESIIDRCGSLGRIRPARSTLFRSKPIYEAYERAQERFRNPPVDVLPIDLDAAHARISRLTVEKAALAAENERYVEKFARWQKNAAARGLTEEFLNTPLPPIDRGQTPEMK